MAKIVSTKFGDRRLVYLPPINIQGSKTPNVETIAPQRQENRQDVGAIVPKDYSYTMPAKENQQNNPRQPFIVQQRPEGNLVLDKPSPQRNIVSERIFEQLIQQANADSLQGYGKGQYPVIAAPQGYEPYKQYTNYGLQTMQPQQPRPPEQPSQMQPGLPPPGQNFQPYNNVMPPMPVHQPPIGGHNPNEKHIYYGPNGEVIPGPPGPPGAPSYNHSQGPFTQDFAIEGLLRHGRLTAVNVFESAYGFPNLPDHLLKDLLIKYGQFELTLVRIVARSGQCYVHATPQIPMVHMNSGSYEQKIIPEQQKTEYVPVYLEEDEEFDYDKFIADYKAGKYRSGDPKSFRSLPAPEQPRIIEYRPPPIREYRHYKKDIPPHRDPVTASGEALRPKTDEKLWQYDRDLPTRMWDTRHDIKRIESLGVPSKRLDTI
ncbi:hypothetical protein ACF0H5_009571 [Mactra antiquata]